MATVRLTDVVVPQVFTDYVTENTAQTSAFVQSGVAQRNGAIESQLRAGAESFNIPTWLDLGDEEANIVNDNPADNSVPLKIGTFKQIVRKAYLHNSWSAMNLASELAGSDALARIQNRVAEYWTRQLQRRLIASLNGILAQNEDDTGDMVYTAPGPFIAHAVITAAGTLGDRMSDLTAIAMHSDIYQVALKNNLIQTELESNGGFIQTFRGLRIIVDDGLPIEPGGAGDPDTYTTVLFAPGAVGWGLTPPQIADGTELESLPSAGKGGGQQILHSRVNLAVHPAGFSWIEDTVASESASLAELALADNWERKSERKNIPIAFLKSTLAATSAE